MPRFNHIQDLAEEGLSIGFRPYFDPKTKEEIRRTWMARILLPDHHEKTQYKGLKFNYEDSDASKREAMRKAGVVYREIWERYKLGLKDLRTIWTVEAVADKFFKEAFKIAQNNKELQDQGIPPRFMLTGANSPLTIRRYNEIWQLWYKYCKPFFEDKAFLDINMAEIDETELRGYKGWLDKTDFKNFGSSQAVSPSTINKSITVIRLLWEYGLERKYVRFVPRIERASPDLTNRGRKKLTEEVYTKMVDWAQQNYEGKPFSQGTLGSLYHQDLAEQFYIYIKFLSWVGFRPPSGDTDRTLLRWADLTILNEGTDDESWMLSRREKVQKIADNPAEYLIQRPVWEDLKRLQELYAERGISDTPYIFAHTHDSSNGVQRGANIGSFRNQWERMLDEIGYPNQINAQQKDRLSFYSIRGYYITCRIDFGKISVADVAKMCNTSSEMIEKIYRKWDIRKVAQNLQKGIPQELL